MLLIGLFAGITVRKHLNPVAHSLPFDLLTIVCGLAVLITALISSQSDMAAAGVIIIGVGIGAAVVKKTDSAVGKMLLMNSHLHDLAGMLLVFVTVGYIVMQVPEWSFIIVIGTLVGYYSVLNLYRGSKLNAG